MHCGGFGWQGWREELGHSLPCSYEHVGGFVQPAVLCHGAAALRHDSCYKHGLEVQEKFPRDVLSLTSSSLVAFANTYLI